MAECNCHVPEGNLKRCPLHGPQRSDSGPEWPEAGVPVADVWLLAGRVRCDTHDADPTFFCQEDPLGMCRGRVKKALEEGHRLDVE